MVDALLALAIAAVTVGACVTGAVVVLALVDWLFPMRGRNG